MNNKCTIKRSFTIFAIMNIHTITCISDNFTQDEISATEEIIRKALSPIEKKINRDDGIIILFLKAEELSYKLYGFSALTHNDIKQILKYI